MRTRMFGRPIDVFGCHEHNISEVLRYGQGARQARTIGVESVCRAMVDALDKPGTLQYRHAGGVGRSYKYSALTTIVMAHYHDGYVYVALHMKITAGGKIGPGRGADEFRNWNSCSEPTQMERLAQFRETLDDPDSMWEADYGEYRVRVRVPSESVQEYKGWLRKIISGQYDWDDRVLFGEFSREHGCEMVY